MKPLIKVCGMTLSDNIRGAEALGIDLMGFIFYEKSPRCVRQRPAYLPVSVRRVGVFVDAPVEEMLARAQDYGLDYLQLHGNEPAEVCRSLRAAGLRVIKAFPVGVAADLRATEAYHEACDGFLFDTKTPAHGGSGQSFDWSALSAYRGTTPFLLSGGIGPDSLAALQGFRHPALMGYDLNSRFETAPGVKDLSSLQTFIHKLKHYEQN